MQPERLRAEPQPQVVASLTAIRTADRPTDIRTAETQLIFAGRADRRRRDEEVGEHRGQHGRDRAAARTANAS